MRVLVTGGAGYIGSVVAELLIQEGHHVVVYDNLSRGHRDAVPEAASFVKGDLLDVAPLRETLTSHRVHAVVHMAGNALVAESTQEPASYYRTNLVGGLMLLEAMRGADVRVIVFSSTAAVYGAPVRLPIEEIDPTFPINPYGESKLAFERALRWCSAAYGLRSASLRYFNAAGASRRYGERHDPETHLIPIVLEAAAGRREAVTIFGDDYPTRDGTCVRDYVHVLDLANAHLLVLRSLEAGPPRHQIYNLGCGGEGYTIGEVIDCARRVTGAEIQARVGPRRPGDPPVLVASSARITKELGWCPERQRLDVIIESAWEWMKKTGVGTRDSGIMRD